MGEWLVRDIPGAPSKMVAAAAIILVCAALAWLTRP
jgi:hypothetical protein